MNVEINDNCGKLSYVRDPSFKIIILFETTNIGELNCMSTRDDLQCML